jgi:hypothetical protein
MYNKRSMNQALSTAMEEPFQELTRVLRPAELILQTTPASWSMT